MFSLRMRGVVLRTKKDPSREVGLQLKFTRIRRGLLQKHVAYKVGISGALLSCYERGLRPIPPDRLLKLYKVIAEWHRP